MTALRKAPSEPLRLWLVVGAVCLGFLGQVALDKQNAVWLGWALLGLSTLVVSSMARPLSGWRPALEPATLSRPFLLWFALVLCAPAWYGFAGNQIRWWGLACWVAAIVLGLLSCRESAGRQESRCGSSGVVVLTWPRAALFVALALGAFLRFYQLRELPADLGWDLPYNFTDAQRILRGEYLVFFTDNFGREGIFFYLIVAVAKAIGLSAYSIRVTSALVGVATIWAIYGLGRACFDAEVGAVAAVALAINRWHLSLTRSGYRVSLMPLFCILALTGLAWALRRGKAWDWARTGLWLGMGLLTYKAFTFAMATILGLVALYAAVALWRSRGTDRDVARTLLGPAILVLVMCIAALPMIRFVVESPEQYTAREMHGGDLVSRSLDEQGLTRTQLYVSNLLTSARMFNERGDGNPRFAVPFQRHLGIVSAVTLLWGVSMAIRQRLGGPYSMLVVSLVGLTLPMTVSMLWGEPPNCFRSSGVIGVSLVIGATALVALRRWLKLRIASLAAPATELHLAIETHGERRQRSIRLQWGLFLAVALWVGMWGMGAVEAAETWRDYFVEFRRVAPDIANYSVAKELSDRIIAYDQGPAYIKVWPYWYDGRAVQEHLGAAMRAWDGEYVTLDPQQPPLRDFSGEVLILMHPDDQETLAAMRSYLTRSAYVIDRYPGGAPSILALYGER